MRFSRFLDFCIIFAAFRPIKPLSTRLASESKPRFLRDFVASKLRDHASFHALFASIYRFLS